MSYFLNRSGVGDYDRVGNWSWEFYPPPYDFLAPANSVSQPPFGYNGRPIPIAPGRPIVASGVGGCGCGGSCGHCGGGMGLFDSMDFTTWGMGEWAVVGFGVYILASMFGDAKRTVGKVSKARQRSSSKAKTRKRLQDLIDRAS